MKKLRHAIYYDNRYGRNDGSPLYYLNVMKSQLEWDIMHLLPLGDTSQFGKFDYHWWVDWGEDGLIPFGYQEWYPPKDGGKTIYVASDTHISDLSRDYRFEKAMKFDYAIFNQRRAMQEYIFMLNKMGLPKNEVIAWIPHAAEPYVYNPSGRYVKTDVELKKALEIQQLKKYDICFIGHIQDQKNFNGITRIDLLDRAFREFPNFYFGTRNPSFPGKNMFEDAALHIAESKIALNISITDDINMRIFETLGAGSMLLTNYIPTLGELFSDGKHLIMYKDLDDMVTKAKYYLSHDEEREKIAKAGHREFLKKHTYRDRIQTIMGVIKDAR